MQDSVWREPRHHYYPPTTTRHTHTLTIQSHSYTTRAECINVFRQTMKMLDTVREEHPAAVKKALDELSPTWLNALQQLLAIDARGEVEGCWEALGLRIEIFRVSCPFGACGVDHSAGSGMVRDGYAETIRRGECVCEFGGDEWWRGCRGAERHVRVDDREQGVQPHQCKDYGTSRRQWSDATLWRGGAVR
jgi:hypothetical protein